MAKAMGQAKQRGTKEQRIESAKKIVDLSKLKVGDEILLSYSGLIGTVENINLDDNGIFKVTYTSANGNFRDCYTFLRNGVSPCGKYAIEEVRKNNDDSVYIPFELTNISKEFLVKENLSLDDALKISAFFSSNLKKSIRDFYLAMDAERIDSSYFENFDATPEKWSYRMRMTLAKYLTTITSIAKTCNNKNKAMTNLTKAMSIYGTECVHDFFENR